MQQFDKLHIMHNIAMAKLVGSSFFSPPDDKFNNYIPGALGAGFLHFLGGHSGGSKTIFPDRQLILMGFV